MGKSWGGHLQLGIIRIVGVGDDGLESLNGKTLGHIAKADLIFGAERLLAFLPDTGAKRIPVKANLDDIVNAIKASRAENIVVLASGDPNFYGIARNLVKAFGKERIEIIPNVSSVQLAFARIKESWDDATFYSVHGRDMDELLDVVRSSRKIAILTDKVNSPSAIARFLLSAGVRGLKSFVCENLGSQNEKVTEAELEGLIDKEFSPLNVLVLLNPENIVQRSLQKWTIGIPDNEFHQRKPLKGLITKAEIRVVSLSKLGIRSNSVVWDVGAGSGSVSIEAALLATAGRVFAVERHADDIWIIKRNVDKFATRNVVVVAGEAPDVLGQLPDPDAVFIGGSGGRMREIVAVAARRLSANGSIVVNVTTIENLPVAVEAMRDSGLRLDVTHVAIARGKSVGSLTRLEALDPIFIVSGRKNS